MIVDNYWSRTVVSTASAIWLRIAHEPFSRGSYTSKRFNLIPTRLVSDVPIAT
jgi:hypothetical protein